MILYKTKIVEYLQSSDKKIVIESTDSGYPFSEKEQISDISVDLRLGTKGYILSSELTELNTLQQDVTFGDYFIEQTLDANGYLLMPHQIIFCPTLEVVKINDRNLMGFVCGRITFARMGISILCDQVKVPFGYKSVIGLQIKNNTEIPIRIFGRQRIAQILFMEVTIAAGPYLGAYGNDLEYTFPIVKESEGFSYSETEWNNIQKMKPKKRYIVSKQLKKRYEWLKQYHTAKVEIWIAYLTGVISGCVVPYLINPKGYEWNTIFKVLVIAGVVMLVLVIVDLIIDHIIFSKKIRGETEDE